MTERLGISPAQTVGPFFHFGLTPAASGYAPPTTIDAIVAGPGAAGVAITLTGRVLDGDGAPVGDAMIELWQADAMGRYSGGASNAFRGFGRSATDKDGTYRFTTIKPGHVPGPGGALQAPHMAIVVFARGLLVHVLTRVYFPDEPSTADDAILALVPGDRRHTLIARADGPGAYVFDIHLQGQDETVFFAM
jgi:protocatechuate 3,4-dioxygenase, alpha subunit